MPDIKYNLTDESGSRDVSVPDYNDIVEGNLCLGQTVANMLLHPDYGNLQSRLKQRVVDSDIGGIVIGAIDRVEQGLLEEQESLELPDEEVLASLQPVKVALSESNTRITITVLIRNILGQDTVVEI